MILPPLSITARKARWIFEGLDTAPTDKITLLAQAMTTAVYFRNKPLSKPKEHGYNNLIPFFDKDDKNVLTDLALQENRLTLN